MDVRSFEKFNPIARFRAPAPTVGVLRLYGVIGTPSPWSRHLSLAGLAQGIEKVFKFRHLKAVALAINSPGGSAAQSALIARRIRAIAEEKDVPVFAFAEDVAASGGYWLACAGDEIYADENSVIGSIGVVSAGFGLDGLIERIGVERRLYTAGDKKALLDPFLRAKPEDVKLLQEIQSDVHESFKRMVRERRRGKLRADEDELFSGQFWTGRKALELGLIDGIGDLRTVMRERFGDKVKLRPAGLRRSWWQRRHGHGIAGGAAAPGPADWADGALAAVEERLWWNRFGL